MSKNKPAENNLDKALNVLDDVQTLIEVQGEPLKIKEFTARQTLKVLSILKEHPNAIPFELFEGEKTTEQQMKIIVNTAAEFGEALIELVCFVLKKGDDWADQLKTDELVDITLAMVKVNKDFFTKTILPKISFLLTSESSEEESKS